MTTLDTAFHTLLSSIGDMNLNEGDFLQLNNVMKKAFEERSTGNTKKLNIKVYLEKTNDERAEYHLDLITKLEGKCATVLAKTIYKGKTDMTSTVFADHDDRLRGLIALLHPHHIVLKIDGLEFVYNYDTCKKRYQEIRDNGCGCDDCCCCNPPYGTIMGDTLAGMYGGIQQFMQTHLTKMLINLNSQHH